MKQNRIYGFMVILMTYVLAVVVAAAVFYVLDGSIFIRVLAADIAATVLVYIVGAIVDNASVYDPYWSVQPIVILLGLALYCRAMHPVSVLLLAAVCCWGVRLTANWAGTFVNLTVQDWRYDLFKRMSPRLFPLISFFGIHLFPTIVVYLALLPAMALMEQNPAMNPITVLGFVICLGATLLQMIADRQMRQFHRQRKSEDELIRIGLWKYSRHPNYLGEILMWWGVYVMMFSVLPGKWYLGIGALVNTLMFFCISIPMADRRNRRKPGYAQYHGETRSLLPVKPFPKT